MIKASRQSYVLSGRAPCGEERGTEQGRGEESCFLEEHRVEKKEERSKGEEKSVRSPGAGRLVWRAGVL